MSVWATHKRLKRISCCLCVMALCLMAALPDDAFAAVKKKKPAFDLWLGYWDIESPPELKGVILEFGKKAQFRLRRSDGLAITPGFSRTVGKRSSKSLRVPYRIPATENALSVLGSSGNIDASIVSGNSKIMNGSFTPQGSAFPVPFLATFHSGRELNFKTVIFRRDKKILKPNGVAKFRVVTSYNGPSPADPGDFYLFISFNGAGLREAHVAVTGSGNTLGKCEVPAPGQAAVKCKLPGLGPGTARAFADISLSIPDELAGRQLEVSAYVQLDSEIASSLDIWAYRKKGGGDFKRFRVRTDKTVGTGCIETNSVTAITIANNTDTTLRFERRITYEGTSDFFEVGPVALKTVELRSYFGTNALIARPHCNGQPVTVNSERVEKSFSLFETVKAEAPCRSNARFDFYDSTFVGTQLVCNQQIVPGENIEFDCPLSLPTTDGVVANRLEQGSGVFEDVVKGKWIRPYANTTDIVEQRCVYFWDRPGGSSNFQIGLFSFIYAPDVEYYNNNGNGFACGGTYASKIFSSSNRQFRVEFLSYVPEGTRLSLGQQFLADYENLGASCP